MDRTGAELYHQGTRLFRLGRVEQAVASFRAAAADPDPRVAQAARRSIACIIPGSADADHSAVLNARREWARAETPATVAWHRHAGRLRIGYLSAFFGHANWMKPVWGVINRHDRTQFDIHLFSDGPNPTASSGYADHDQDHIHDMAGTEAAQAARIIAACGIDILVDLNGYSFQDRLVTLMARPAPVIVGWFNMFATTGIPGFDWLVGDATVIPPDEEPHYVERIHRVPGTYLAFDVAYRVPDVAPPPCLVRGEVTFGCLGSQYKLTDAVLGCWGDILRATPSSRLHLRNGALDDPAVRADTLARLGVAPERVTIQGRAEHTLFLQTYDAIDVALDTFPYNGGTTTTEALWQGVPVLTFAGDRWAGRTSASLLHAAGLSDWVMPDRDTYVRRAVALAADPPDAAFRAGLRGRVRASAACDSAGLCAALEAFYRQVA